MIGQPWSRVWSCSMHVYIDWSTLEEGVVLLYMHVHMTGPPWSRVWGILRSEQVTSCGRFKLDGAFDSYCLYYKYLVVVVVVGPWPPPPLSRPLLLLQPTCLDRLTGGGSGGHSGEEESGAGRCIDMAHSHKMGLKTDQEKD